MENPITIPSEKIVSKIYIIRNRKVMLDKDLAELYGVETKVFNQAVKRNIKRFPEDFMFVLNEKEIKLVLSLDFVPSKKHLGGSSPFAFTEQGVRNAFRNFKQRPCNPGEYCYYENICPDQEITELTKGPGRENK